MSRLQSPTLRRHLARAATAACLVTTAAATGASAQFSYGGPAEPSAAVKSQTEAAYRSAYVIVYGRAATPDELKAASPRLLCADGSNAANTVWCARVWEAVNFGQAVTALKARLLAPSRAVDRAAAIDAGYHNAFGRVASAEEQAYWEAKMMAEKLWYAPVAAAQLAWLNRPDNRATERAATVARVYRASMGREPTPQESGYWLARSEHYMGMLGAARTWLYSPEGATDLVATVRRAAAVRLGRAATDGEVKVLMGAATASRAVYEDMLGLP
jgi:hypothetical protein